MTLEEKKQSGQISYVILPLLRSGCCPASHRHCRPPLQRPPLRHLPVYAPGAQWLEQVLVDAQVRLGPMKKKSTFFT
jgi:hypothetical protein